VAYGGKAGSYHCEGALANHGAERCISFGGLRADQAVGAEVLRVLKPLGVHAAVRALDARAGETSAARRQLGLLNECRPNAFGLPDIFKVCAGARLINTEHVATVSI
jgi:hypothetical protein